MTLTRVGHAPGSQAESEWHDAIGAAVARQHGTVCAVCGLANMGHAPEAEWLGYERHAYTPVAADAAMLTRANELTSAAYRARRENGTHSFCGHRYGGKNCATNCPHVGGHCANCA